MAKTSHGGSKPTIQSVKTSLDIIDAIHKNGKMTMMELADELGHSKSTIYNHLYTLEEGKIVVCTSEGYRLSLRTLDIAYRARDQVVDFKVLQSEVDNLAEDTNEIVQFGIEEYGKVSYLYKMTKERGMGSASRIGKQQPMYSTGIGKAIFAHLTKERQKELLHQITFEEITPHTISNQSELLEELVETRERGYAIDDEENIEGIRCIAAPVKEEGTVLGAVSITGPSSRITLDRIHNELSEKIHRTTNVIELKSRFSD